MSVVGLTFDPRASIPKHPTCCLSGPLMVKAGSARKLGEEMEPQQDTSPQFSKRLAKPLQQGEKKILSFLLKFMRLFGVGGPELCQARSTYWIPLAILSWWRAAGSTTVTPHQGSPGGLAQPLMQCDFEQVTSLLRASATPPAQ